MDIWCGACGFKWESDRSSTYGVKCPKGCQNIGPGKGIYMDLVVVILTSKGDGGEYETDYEYGVDSTYSYNDISEEHTYEKVEFIPDGQVDPTPTITPGEIGAWVSSGVVIRESSLELQP